MLKLHFRIFLKADSSGLPKVFARKSLGFSLKKYLDMYVNVLCERTIDIIYYSKSNISQEKKIMNCEFIMNSLVDEYQLLTNHHVGHYIILCR